MAMLNMFVKTTALETAYFGVRINAVAPGVTISDARTKKYSFNFSESQNRTFLQESA
jgi:NAD(P)-dependent dehydrogenase (short-subunit alcohol dehydrogenase family)